MQIFENRSNLSRPHNPKKLEAVSQFPRPENPKNIKLFLDQQDITEDLY